MAAGPYNKVLRPRNYSAEAAIPAMPPTDCTALPTVRAAAIGSPQELSDSTMLASAVN